MGVHLLRQLIKPQNGAPFNFKIIIVGVLYFKMKIQSLSIYSQTLQTILLPILLLQGWKLRRNTIELPEAMGKRQGTIGKGREIGLIFLGDSSACGVGVSHLNESLSGNLLKILTKKYLCNWKVFAKSKLMTSELNNLILKDEKRKFDIAENHNSYAKICYNIVNILR